LDRPHCHSISLAPIGNFLRRVFGELFVMAEACIDVSPDNPTSEPQPDAFATKVGLYVRAAVTGSLNMPSRRYGI
jgi:hypothetical protein